MGQLVFQATLGGQVNLVGPNTASSFNLDVPAVSATLATTAANTFTAVQTFSAGSASAPAITTSGDTNTGIFFPAADTIAFSEGGTESARIDSGGNFGLGVTPSAWSTDRKALQVNRGGLYAGNSANYITLFNNVYYDGTSLKYIANGAASYYAQGTDGASAWNIAASGTAGNAITFTQAMTLDASGRLGIGATSLTAKLTVSDGTRASVFVEDSAGRRLRLQSPDSSANPATIGTSTNHDLLIEAGSSAAGNVMRFNVGGSERARIDDAGNLLIGLTSALSQSAKIAIRYDGNAINGIIHENSTATTYDSNIFRNSSGTTVGYIRSTTGATSYVTSSDYRLKHDIAPMTGALAKVSALKPVTYKWNIDGVASQGFIAHELAEVVPDCVTGTKDAVDANGNPVYQGIDTSFLVATLTAAIQELNAKFEAYKATHP